MSCGHVTVLPMARRTASVAATPQALPHPDANQGAHVIINVNSINSGTPSITVTVQGYDETNGTFYDMLVSSAISSTGQTILKIHPLFTPAPNLTACDILPLNWGVKVDHADSQPITYSVSANVFD